MSFEETVNGWAGQSREATLQDIAARTELLRTFVTAGRRAARSMRNSLAVAAHTLSRHAVPTDLAVVTAGPDGARCHYKVVGEGWHLPGDPEVLAFLTVDGKIFLDGWRRGLPGLYLSPDTAEAVIEKRNHDGTHDKQPKRLENPHRLVPGTGKLIDMGREWDGSPFWSDKPEVLIGFGAGSDPSRVTALWPKDVPVNSPGTRFDQDGKIWLTHSDGASHRATELDRWLVDRLASRLT